MENTSLPSSSPVLGKMRPFLEQLWRTSRRSEASSSPPAELRKVPIPFFLQIGSSSLELPYRTSVRFFTPFTDLKPIPCILTTWLPNNSCRSPSPLACTNPHPGGIGKEELVSR